MTDKDTDTTEAQPDERIERYDTGASIEVDITRGTGTRDQEKWKLKGKGESAEAAIQELAQMLDEVRGEVADDVALGDQLRSWDPSGGGDD